jgi:hypothetical protein
MAFRLHITCRRAASPSPCWSSLVTNPTEFERNARDRAEDAATAARKGALRDITRVPLSAHHRVAPAATAEI